jgi:hypothetical protein
MKRQRGRNRGGGASGGKPQQQNANRAFDSNGPEGAKVRGNAQHVFEKYQQLARDATSAGDRVLAENYLQHAEHYFRVVRAMQPTKPASEILGRDSFSSGFDIDFEDESGAQAAAAADAYAAENESQDNGDQDNRGGWQDNRPDSRQDSNRQDSNRQDSNRQDRPRDDRPRDRDDRPRFRDRDDRPRDDRPREERPRDERPRDDRPRDDRPREDRGDRQQQPREDRPQQQQQPREDRPRGDRFEGNGRRDRWRERDDRPREDRDPLAVVEPQAAPLLAPVAEKPSPVLRDDDGGESQAPAFLKAPRAKAAPAAAAPAAEAPAGEVAKPRRRRAPRSFEGGTPPETEEV